MHASLYHYFRKNKLTLDLSRYIWNCTWNLENDETFMASLKLGGNDKMTHSLWKKLSLEFLKCIIVVFQLAIDFTRLTSQWLFLCATFLDSEPLHFASKSDQILQASLYNWSLKNKPTLDLSRYIWKSLVGDMSCCNFFLISNCSRIVSEIWKMSKLWWNSWKLVGND